MSKGKEKTLIILETIKEHYGNTMLIDDTDKESLKEVNEAIRWVKSK